MRSTGLIVVTALVLASCAGPSFPGVRGQEPGEHRGHRHDATASHGFEDVEHWVRVFDDPERDTWQLPDEVIAFLDVGKGQRVADLGAGTGYFTVHLARAVGPSGAVYAVDIEPALIDHLRERAADAGMDQVRPVLAEPDDPGLPEKELDWILVVNTWHHINDRLVYLDTLAKTLKPGGRLVVIDFREGKLPVGPPPGHKLSREEVVGEFAEAGWGLEREGKMLPYQYLLVLAPTRGNATH
jgi:SAM-dependent methyltransferase